jgi:hypothetical protein
MNKPVVGIAALLLAACAGGPSWQKEGVSREAAEADAYTCRTQAPIEPRVQGGGGLPSGPGQRQGAGLEVMADREAERMQKENRFVADCMRAKGYSAR